MSEEDCADLVENEQFIESLATCVKRWNRDIQEVSKMNYAVSQGNTLQEINFWISKEKSLNMIEQQLKLPEVDLTL